MKLITKKQEQVMAFEKQQMLYELQSRDAIIATLKRTIEIQKETLNLYKDSELSKEKTIKSLSEEVSELQKKNEKLELLFLTVVPSEFPVEKIMDDCATAAWIGEKEMSTRVFESLDSKVKLFFEGTVYEQTHEYFVPDCNVYYMEDEITEKQPLYTVDRVKTGSKDAVRKYILKKNLGYREVL